MWDRLQKSAKTSWGRFGLLQRAMSESEGKDKGRMPSKTVVPPQPQQVPGAPPGEGLRSVKTTNVFRALNFELYMKPNKTTMVLGLVSISMCVGYLVYWNWNIDRSKYYTATKDDGTFVLHPKKSRWES